jgi:hypothetical protein
VPLRDRESVQDGESVRVRRDPRGLWEREERTRAALLFVAPGHFADHTIAQAPEAGVIASSV